MKPVSTAILTGVAAVTLTGTMAGPAAAAPVVPSAQPVAPATQQSFDLGQWWTWLASLDWCGSFPGTPGQPAPERPAPQDPPAPEKPSPEKPAPEKPTPGQPGPEKPAPGKPGPEEPAPENPGGSFDQQVAAEMVRLVNGARAQAGLNPVQGNQDLDGVAANWSRTMAASGNFRHNPDFAQQIRATGASTMSENIAMGYPGKDPKATAGYFFDMWMNSPGHRANILGEQMNAAGLGLATGADGAVYATQNFARY